MMNYIKLFLFNLILCALLLFPMLIDGQSITEKLGGVITGYTIKSDSILLNHDRQVIIQRGAHHIKSNNALTGGKFGYGFQSFYLEFTSNKEFQIHKNSNFLGVLDDPYYSISLIDKSGTIYQDIILSNADILIHKGKNGDEAFYAYSINLNKIPLVELDSLIEINILRIK